MNTKNLNICFSFHINISNTCEVQKRKRPYSLLEEEYKEKFFIHFMLYVLLANQDFMSKEKVMTKQHFKFHK